MISTKPEEAKVEYIKYTPDYLPEPENIQDDFQYWKSIEKLDANIALKNAWWLVKISSTDTTSWYLENKLVAWNWINISKLNPSWNEQLKIDWELVYWWSWIDWDLIITNWQTITLDASTDIQIKNYSSIDIQSWWVLNIQDTNTAPVVLKSLWNINIQWTINFNSTYNSATVYPASLLASWATFTPTWKLDTNKWWTDLIINCIWNFNASWWSINLWATSPAIPWTLRIVSWWNYVAWTYTSSWTTIISNPTIF